MLLAGWPLAEVGLQLQAAVQWAARPKVAG